MYGLKLVIVSWLQADILWITCLEELIHQKKQIGDFGLCFPQESSSNTIKISSRIESITRENIQKLITTCYPELEENFLQCLRKNNVPFQVSPEEDESKKCLGSLSSRRYLGDGESATKSSADKKSTKKSSKSSTIKSKDHKKAVYDAIAKTALVTFLAATLLFLCCCSCCRRGRVKQTDERPLLSMSLNDYSVGTY